MEIELKNYLIARLNECNKKISKYESAPTNWSDLRAESQHNLDRLKAGALISKILVFILLTITILISFIKIWSESNWPDLNKGAILILLTTCNVLTVFFQKMRIIKLEKEILLLNILERIDVKNTNFDKID